MTDARVMPATGSLKAFSRRPSSRRHVAGVDCSTQSTKVIVVDIDSGDVVAIGRSANPVMRDGPKSETNPEAWWLSLRSAINQTGMARHILSISIAAQQLGLVTLDADHQPLRNAILWDDTRSGDAASQLIDALGGAPAWAELVGTQPQAGLTVASWAWLRKAEPETVERTRHIRLPHDYLTERLSGAAVTDRGDASGTGWWSGRKNDYVGEVLSLIEVDVAVEMLPKVLGADAAAGKIRPAAAAELGLQAGTMVASGTGDNMGAALGLGIRPGQPVISLGTSGTAYARSPVPPMDLEGRIFADASCSGDHLPLACTLNATLAVDHMAQLLGLDREDVAENDNVVVLPYFHGERLPNYPFARCSIVGLRDDTSQQELLLATYRGAAFSLIQSIGLLDQQGAQIKADEPITLVGGGARGRVWQKTIQELSGRALQLPARQEHVALGAAAQAAAILTGEKSEDIARRWKTREGILLEPVPVCEGVLDRLNSVQGAMDSVNRQKLFT